MKPHRAPASRRLGPGLAGPFLALILTVCLLGLRPPTSAAAEVVRWKFKPGEVLHYAMEQKAMMSVRGIDRESKSTRSQTVDMSWRVNRVAGTGQAEITQRIERVRMRVEAPPFLPFEFDSAKPKNDAPGPFEAEAQQLQSMAGAEFSFKMKPTGEIDDIKFSEQTLKAFREAAPRGAPASDVSETVLKDMLLQSSPPAFPEGPLEPGKSWSSRPAKVPNEIGTIVLDKTFTFQGPDPKSPRLMRVAVETRVRLEPTEGPNVRVEIRRQDGKGTMTFDAEAGHIVNTRGTQHIDLSITLMDQRIEQSTETITLMTLAP